MQTRWLVALAVLFLSTAAVAQEAAPPAPAEPAAAPACVPTPAPTPKEEKWKATAGVSAIINTGNAENQTVGGNALTSYKFDRNKMEWTGDVNYGRAKDNTTGATTTNTNNWKTALRYDRFLMDNLSAFGLGQVGWDRPGGIDLRYGGSAGIAHELWKTDPDYFKYEFGGDVTYEDRTAPPNDTIYAVRTFLRYQRKIQAWATFGQDVEALFNVEDGNDTRLNSLTSLTMKLVGKLAFKAGFEVRFDNQPVPGKKKTDTSTQMGLVMEFL